MDGINSPGTTTLGVEVPDHVANTDHSQSSGNSGNGTSKPNGWNGPFAPKKDPYALLRGHMANSRYTELLSRTLTLRHILTSLVVLQLSTTCGKSSSVS